MTFLENAEYETSLSITAVVTNYGVEELVSVCVQPHAGTQVVIGVMGQLRVESPIVYVMELKATMLNDVTMQG